LQNVLPNDEILIVLSRQMNFDRGQKVAAIGCLATSAPRIALHLPSPPSTVYPYPLRGPHDPNNTSQYLAKAPVSSPILLQQHQAG
jgi:hypothetical protein